VFGGSQGAARINRAARALADLWADESGLQIVHITGGSGDADRSARPQELIYRSVAFVDRMIEAYAVADLALCRGGASTVAELAAIGLPAVVVPYPHHRDRQQERQGRVLERAGAAVVLADDETTTERVAREADALLGDDDALARMSAATAALARPDAARDLARVVEAAA
jgi:UDP-N-acetylglucosamine--N-acetylmuramyl-(pentapeptide) pyrophosphoryl-undecaprenol N-acetylglucosamine transferase